MSSDEAARQVFEEQVRLLLVDVETEAPITPFLKPRSTAWVSIMAPRLVLISIMPFFIRATAA